MDRDFFWIIYYRGTLFAFFGFLFMKASQKCSRGIWLILKISGLVSYRTQEQQKVLASGQV